MNGKLSTASIPLLIFLGTGLQRDRIGIYRVTESISSVRCSLCQCTRPHPERSSRAADLQLLNTRYGAQIDASEEDLYITLATRRDTVETINERKLTELPGDPVVFEGEINGDFPESSLPTSKELTLKPGAQIIFIKNDFERRWVNGTIGVVSGIDNDGIIYVITDDGKECDVHRESWRNIRYKYNEEKRRLRKKNWVLSHNIPSAWHGPSPCTKARV